MTDQFHGFDKPTENWSKLPHELINRLPDFTSQGEIMVVLYILRHTWGFQEFDEGKKITLDEFELGRKRRDRTRIDNGVGMSRAAILKGIKKAVEHGFIEVEEDNSDLARRKRWYKLSMAQRCRNLTPEVTKQYRGGNETVPRSEKDTRERNEGKKAAAAKPKPTPKPPTDHLDLALNTKIAQDKRNHPITFLSETVAQLLGLAKVPNHKFDELWESPLRDLLDQSDADVDKVETALRAAVLEGAAGGMTMTTPNSLHGLALKALATPPATTSPNAIIFKEVVVPDGWTLPKREERQ